MWASIEEKDLQEGRQGRLSWQRIHLKWKLLGKRKKDFLPTQYSIEYF
jgi:hypothetical protein